VGLLAAAFVVVVVGAVIATNRENAQTRGVYLRSAPDTSPTVPLSYSPGLVRFPSLAALSSERLSAGAADVGVPESMMVTALRRSGLLPLVVTLSSPSVPAGDVVFTSPGSSHGVAPGSTVTVFVSSGPAVTATNVAGMAVPDVVGQPVYQAEDTLAAAGFRAGLTAGAMSQTQETVTGENPQAGTSVPAGTTVDLSAGS
jgi:hypothetical protein